MNLILFQTSDEARFLPLADPRSKHILEILKLGLGDTFKSGLLGGNQGQSRILTIDDDGITLESKHQNSSIQPLPITLLIGTPRPPTARRLIKDLTTIGVSRMAFVATELGEKSYLSSHLWTKGDWKGACTEGAMQAGNTSLPQVKTYDQLYKALKEIKSPGSQYFFDPSAEVSWWETLKQVHISSSSPLSLALGPERGWSDREKEMLKGAGWEPRGLGGRILRTETAAVLTAGSAASLFKPGD